MRGSWFSADALDRMRRILAGVLLTFLLLPLEGVLGRLRLPPFPPGAPWLGLLLVMSAGYLFDREHGGIMGLFVGLLADCMSDGIMLRPLSYFLLGWLAGQLAHARLAHNLPSFVVFAAVGSVMEGLFRVGAAAVTGQEVPPIRFIWYSVLPHIVMTVLASPGVYGVVYVTRKMIVRR